MNAQEESNRVLVALWKILDLEILQKQDQIVQ